MILLENYIDGQFAKPINGQYLDCHDPSTGHIYAKVPDSTNEDLEQAIHAAKNAFPSWSQLPIDERSHILMKVADLIESNLDHLAACESLDNGKPVRLARTVDIPRAAANFRFFASAIVNESTQAHVMETVAVNYTRRVPLGIVGCISPWNLPLYLLTWKVAPALATGNCVIAKPSEITPYTAYLLCSILKDAGMPPGVLNILHGNGAQIGQQIVNHPAVNAISFTGGTETGRMIGMEAARNFKKVSLELGGKNPVVVFDDCAIEQALTTSVQSAFTNQGEICLCGSRILIQESLYPSFRDQFVRSVQKLKVGNPKQAVDLGPLVSEQHLNKVHTFVEEAVAQGAQILTGGSKTGNEGYFYRPTVMEGLDEHCVINQEEVFGPVVTLLPFVDEADAISKANATQYGLATVIWTQDLTKAHRVAHGMQSGIVWVNCWMLRDLRTPFGGMKSSGIGREGGDEALRFFTEPQNICIRL